MSCSLNSYGMIVGRSGVVNVGSLTITTPTKETLDKLIKADGSIDTSVAGRVIRGDVPLSPDGSVIIRGAIVAQHGVRIDAHDVLVAGSTPEALKAARQRAIFKSPVNAHGLREGGAIVVRNGGIEIVASSSVDLEGRLVAGGTSRRGESVSIRSGGDFALGSAAKIIANAPKTGARAAVSISAAGTATIAGLIDVRSAAGGQPGSIAIAGHEIVVASSTILSAQGVGAVNAGHIAIKAQDLTKVASGAQLLANALGSGDGGQIEISGHKVEVGAGVVANLGAVSGKAGALLFDPDDLIVGGQDKGSQGDNPSVGPSPSTVASLYSNGGSVELDAANSITVNGVIDTRAYAGDTTSPIAGSLAAANVLSTGNSGAITLNAPSITVAPGALLLADVNNATGANATHFAAGAVALTSVATATTAASVTIGGA